VSFVAERTDGEANGDATLPVPVADPTPSETVSVPDPVEPRPYIEIRPAETTVDPGAVGQAMDLLHTLLADFTQMGLKDRLFGSTQIPFVEWLLLSDGREDPQIRYLVGTTHSDLTEDLLGVLRTCFPNSYEFREIEFHPRYIEEFLPIVDTAEQPATTSPSGQEIDTRIHPYVAGVEYRGQATRKRDWQTPLQRFGRRGAIRDETRWTPGGDQHHYGGHNQPTDTREESAQSHRIPLAPLVETIREAGVPVCYQVVCRPYDDWTSNAEGYLKALDEGRLGLASGVVEFLSPRSREQLAAYEPPLEDRNRIAGIQQRDPQRTFAVSARAVAMSRERPGRVEAVARRLRNALSSVNGQYHTIVGHVQTDDELHGSTVPPGSAIFEDLCSRALYDVAYEASVNPLSRKTPESAGIVVGPAELPGLCLIDGTGLTPGGQRALAARRRERTGLTLPPPQQLMRYRPPGMALCMPLTHDRQPYGQPLYLRPSQQDRHLVVVGDTGAGKSVLMERAVLTNREATAGPEILFDYKGGGTAEEYLRAHFVEYGNLDDVLYFDLSRVLPAFSFFDIQPLLDAGISREEARSRTAGHYEEILKGLLGAEKYGEAAESVKAIRNHLRALYDPVHGSDAFSHSELYHVLQRAQRGEEMPPTSDEQLTAYFNGLAERDRDIFTKVLGGAVGRVETIATDGRLAPVFDHVPVDAEDEGDGDGDQAPHFDFTDWLDEDAVIVFDFGGMESSVKRTLTMVILSNLWRALKAREQATRGTDTQLSQVNLYLEEARDVGATKLMDTLLSEGRSFGLSMALGVQFLEQLNSPDPSNNTYQEALNETATFVVGNVSVDTDLPRALATEAMDPEGVARRLSAMGRGEWLVRPGSTFDADPVKPFLGESLPAPAGHPASEAPLEGQTMATFREAFERVQKETASTSGLVHAETGLFGKETVVDEDSDTEADTDSEDGPDEEVIARSGSEGRVDTLLTHTKRMPSCVRFDAQTDALCCANCENRYDPSITGMVRAIECCHDLEEVDSDDIPICEFNLKLSPTEIGESEWSLKQLLFIQAVYNAQQLRYDPLEYDLMTDSMLRLREYVGIETDEVQELLDAKLARIDGDHPHRLYSVSPDGRKTVGESYREGIDYGHGKGDLEESSEHVLGVQLGIQLLEQDFRDDPESDVEIVRPYHELRKGELPASAFMGTGADVEDATEGYEQRRLDVAGLDSEENVIVAIEVERVNHDTRRAVPDDFDKMAACGVEEAIWIVISRKDGHEVLAALNDPLEGPPRVEKRYSTNTPPSHFNIDTPGLTDIYPIGYVMRELEE